ncbi:glycosyltransferase family 1 protein [Xylariaceae sp. FL0255]|nr:glycosyltransferase family 1 protein [Xylariaceae sp. FL0255]
MPKCSKQGGRPSRTAFVTIGATAGFRPLLEEVVSGNFLDALRSLHFTHLIVQCGPDLAYFESIKPKDALKSHGLEISSFSYAPGLNEYFILASRGKGEVGERDCGVIISHAGSGSILDALECDSKLVAVPNTSLMDNHQLQIAEDMESKGFLVHGVLGSITEAIMKIETFTPRKWPPDTSPNSAYQEGGVWDAINASMPKAG